MKNYVSLHPVADSSDLLESLVDKRKQIREMADFYLQELQKLDSAYQILAGSNVTGTHFPLTLKRMKWTTIALECLRSSNKLLKTADILKTVFAEDSVELEVPQKRRMYITGLSVALNKLIQNNRICKIEIKGEKGNFYGLKEWFLEDQVTLIEEMDHKLKERLQVSQ